MKSSPDQQMQMIQSEGVVLGSREEMNRNGRNQNSAQRVLMTIQALFIIGSF